jgi:YegS/Rv2252/BmrU family lipid kinase
MTSVAVVAHAGKTLGGGLSELRRVLGDAGVGDPIWYEVPKSKYAPKCVQRALGDGADLLLVWGGDGMVQRSIDAIGEAPVPLAILPAGTGNLLARNLGIPIDLEAAVDVALHGARRTIDVGRVNGERFAVMAGTGLDALMIRDADRALKGRFGRAAYVWTGAKHLRLRPFRAEIDVDGTRWFDGATGCILVGNVAKVFGGIEAFDDASPDDGRLELGVVTAKGIAQWTRTLVRTAADSADRSKFVRTTKARKIRVKLDRKMPYELDGGDEKPVDRLKFRVEPAAITVCVPEREDS